MVIILHKYSEITHTTTHTPMSIAALHPKNTTDATEAGSKDITTSSIIFLVEAVLRKWGEDDENNLLIF